MGPLATSIDLSGYSAGIFDQGREGACAENALCSAIVLQANEYHQPIGPLSRQQLYNDTLIAENKFGTDFGTVLSYMYKVAQTNGIANESSFAYSDNNLYVRPSAAVEAEANTQKLLSITSLNIYQTYTDIAKSVKQALMQGKVVLTGTQHLTLADGTYIDGGHEFLIVGMNDVTAMYKIQNSWGAGWGDNGYGYIKYSEFGVGYGHPTVELLSMDVVNGFKGVDQTWTEERREAAQLYTAILNRSGENAGIVGWANLLKTGVPLTVMADAFYNSPEGQALYAPLTDTQYVNQMFHNILNRDVDTVGLNFFLGLLASHAYTRSQLLVSTMMHVDQFNSIDPADASTIASHNYLENRTNVSLNYGITYQIDGTHYQVSIDSLHGVTSNPDDIQTALVGVRHELGWA